MRPLGVGRPAARLRAPPRVSCPARETRQSLLLSLPFLSLIAAASAPPDGGAAAKGAPGGCSSSSVLLVHRQDASAWVRPMVLRATGGAAVAGHRHRGQLLRAGPPPRPGCPAGARALSAAAAVSRADGGGELSPLAARVLDALRGPCGVAPGSTLVVGVSGGLDSTALLHLLVEARAAPGWRARVEVVHFDHRLRSESGAEARFVRKLAEGAGLTFHAREMPPAQAARFAADPGGMQAWARDWRRREMEAVARASGGDDAGAGAGDAGGEAVLVTAHHSDDQAETVLLKLLRGAHLSSLQGMPWADARAPRQVRPLLAVGKPELEAYLRARALAWMEDGSNADAKYNPPPPPVLIGHVSSLPSY